jgi:23S rRNA (adenine2503-C2)-methyltransferase
MMGMDEPLYNFDAVRDALLIVATLRHRHLAPRITLSTSGVVPNIVRTGDEIGVMQRLAACGARRLRLSWCRSAQISLPE